MVRRPQNIRSQTSCCSCLGTTMIQLVSMLCMCVLGICIVLRVATTEGWAQYPMTWYSKPWVTLV